jgi:hypothetical protein
MISILLPTRERFENCSQTIISFFENVRNPDNIEFIIRCDNDDLLFLEKLHLLPYFNRLKIIIGDRERGYIDLHLFYNEMLKISTGKYVMPINDDLICKTKYFDDIILSKPIEDIKIYIGKNNNHYQGWYFPIINKKILDEIGYLSRCVFYDGYLYFSLLELDIYREIPELNFEHFILNDNLSLSKDKTLNEINSGNIKHLDLFKEYMNQDREKVKKIL